MMRLTAMAPWAALLAGCAFEGGGIAPLRPAAPASVAEDDLEVPFVPTPRAAVTEMFDMVQLVPEDFLIDLGSGDGRIPIMAAEQGARALGVEIDPVRVAEARAAAALAPSAGRVQFRRQDLFETPLGQASVVTLYLLPEINLRLRPRLLTELRPGARVVSHAFGMGDWLPDERREAGSSVLMLWIVPAPVEGRWAVESAGVPLGELEFEQRFQQVSGRLNGRPLREVKLRGRSLVFTADLPDGPHTFRGSVVDSGIAADPGEGVGWSARRIG